MRPYDGVPCLTKVWAPTGGVACDAQHWRLLVLPLQGLVLTRAGVLLQRCCAHMRTLNSIHDAGPARMCGRC